MSTTIRTRPNDSDREAAHLGGDVSHTGEVSPQLIEQHASTVVCCLDHELLDRLAERISYSIAAKAPHELIDVVTLGGVRLVVADPCAGNGECGQILIRLRASSPSVPIVIYTVLTPAVVPSIVQLAQQGVRDVITYGTDDTKARFDEILERESAASLSLAILGRLEPRLRMLPEALAGAIREMFDSPRRVSSVEHLAAAGGMHRRSVYRNLANVGISSPRLLVASARILRAAHLLAETSLTVREIATSLGFSKPEVMSLQFKNLTGLRPGQLRNVSRLPAIDELIAQRLEM
jgi:AraC-like DNA-binding protein